MKFSELVKCIVGNGVLLNFFNSVGGPPTNLMAVQTGIDSVGVSWTAAPGGGMYRVTADSGGVSVDTPFPSQTII